MLPDIRFSLRRMVKNRFTTLINLTGLTIGIFVSLALINYHTQESSYDRHHEKADRTLKAVSKVEFNRGASEVFSITFGTLAESLKLNFEEVEHTARMYGPDQVEVDLENRRFNDITLLRTDHSFFQVFDFDGANDLTFNSPDDAILSLETANKLFNGDAIGKQITVENQTYTVTAVTKIPRNTVFKFDVVLPLSRMSYFREMVHGGLEFETYVTLKEGMDITSMERQLASHYDQLMESKWPDYIPSNFFLPIKEVYLNDRGVNNRMGTGDQYQLTIILTIAFVVLILALINYINLQVANNHSRVSELRLKRIMGADKKVLVKQYVLESSILLFSSTLLAIGLLEIFQLYDLQFLSGENELTTRGWDWKNWGTLVGAVLLLSLLTGVIPSQKLFRSSGLTQQMIGDKKLGKSTVALVVFQFFITATLLTTILFVNKQMDFLKNQHKGYSSEQVIMIDNLGTAHQERYQLLRSQLLENTSIISVGGAQNAPGAGASGQFVHRNDKPSDEGIEIAHIRSLEGYAKTLQLKFVHGGDFTIKNPGNENQFILNETAANLLFQENEQVIGSVINMSGRVGKIVGVVEDFHYLSMKNAISPLAINVEEPYEITLMIKVQTENLSSILSHVEEVLRGYDPLYVFDYQFLDEQFALTYEADIRTKKVITYATIIAFSISIMGLLALSIFVINSKVKEIAIRKTLGGSQQHLFIKLSSGLMLWIMLGNLIAIPLTYYVTSLWVQEFVYQISLHHLLWMSLASTGVTLAVSLTIIMRKLHKTLSLNPVEFLKYE